MLTFRGITARDKWTCAFFSSKIAWSKGRVLSSRLLYSWLLVTLPSRTTGYFSRWVKHALSNCCWSIFKFAHLLNSAHRLVVPCPLSTFALSVGRRGRFRIGMMFQAFNHKDMKGTTSRVGTPKGSPLSVRIALGMVQRRNCANKNCRICSIGTWLIRGWGESLGA